MKTRSLCLSLLLGMAVLGCNGGSSSSAGTTGTETKGAEGKPLRVVFIPKDAGNPYFNEIKRGFEDACKEMGAEFNTTGPATAGSTTQIPIIKEQIQRGVDVIAIAPNSPDALNQVMDQAKSRGIVVLTVDADLVGNESHRDACILPTDFSQVGEGQAELMGKLIGHEGEIAILSATADAPNQNAWIAKMKETFTQPKYAKMKLVEVAYGDDEPEKSTTECEALLTKHPNLRGIISPTSVGLAAAAKVFEQRGVYPGGPNAAGKGIELTGLSLPSKMEYFVDKGIVKEFQLWEPYNEGFVAAYLGQQIKSGKLKPADGAEIEIPKLGKRTFTKNLELVGGPLTTFSKENIAQYKF